MQCFEPRSVINLLLCLCLGLCCCTRKVKPEEPLMVKKDIKKDIINCRYPDRMTTAYTDTVAKTSKKKKNLRSLKP